MTARARIATVTRITDDDCGMYRIGEVDGGFDEEQLKQLIDNHGEFAYHELLSTLSFMTYQVQHAWRGRNAGLDQGCAAEASG